MMGFSWQEILYLRQAAARKLLPRREDIAIVGIWRRYAARSYSRETRGIMWPLRPFTRSR